jgi:hypothetical protein
LQLISKFKSNNPASGWGWVEGSDPVGVLKTEQGGAYRAVQPNSEGKLPVVKVWDEASGKYVPVLCVTGGGGGDDGIMRSIIERTFSEISDTEAKIVADYAFYRNKNIKSVNLPNVDGVGVSAFEACWSLESVILPNVTRIDNAAFQSCYALTDINLPELEIAGLSAFSGARNLSNVFAPKLKVVGQGAFQGCGMRFVDLPAAETIEGDAFRSCSYLILANLPNAKALGSGAFQECYNLGKIYAPEAEEIGYMCFDYCENLSIVDLPKVTIIGAGAFSRCNYLEAVILRSELVGIYENAFRGLEMGSLVFVYVPAASMGLYETNYPAWFADGWFRAIEDYPEICG